MKKKLLFEDNIIVGYLYFYIHLITETICFFSLKRVIGDSMVLWIVFLLYDVLAFVPQGVIGYFNDKYKFNSSIIGTVIMIIGLINFILNIVPSIYLSIGIIAIGNAFVHIGGAEATLRCSKGRMSHSAIFVSGGSFGVIIGKILGSTSMSMWFLIFLALTMIPFILLADSYKDECSIDKCKYNYANKKINPRILILLITLLVAIRGYTGYGIPTSWNKTILENILLFSFMGIGKALGGILIDLYGIKKTALYSVILAIPFLIIGDNLMIVSLIGVMLFSMTMAVTLGLLVSINKKNPGLMFGYTTIGLFLGSLPIFFYKINNFWINSVVVCVLSLLCVYILNIVIRKDDDNE